MNARGGGGGGGGVLNTSGGVLKMSGLDKKTKDLIKQALTKTEPFLTFCIKHTPASPTTKTRSMYIQQQIQRPCLENLK